MNIGHKLLAGIFYVIYPYKIHKLFQSALNILHTLWIRNRLGYLGEHSKICYKCRISGGAEKNIIINDYVIFERYSIIECFKHYGKQSFHNAKISIGNHCNIGEYNHITAINGITIGDGVLTGRFVLISDNSHGNSCGCQSNIRPAMRNLESKGEIVIGNNVWLGDKVTVLSGVHIGNNVIIGANSVVTKNIPSNCIAVGSPAKIIKKIS